jgi:hypothetical protein
VISVSDVPYDEHTCIPRTMTLEDIERLKQQFVDTTKRALKAGFDVRTRSSVAIPFFGSERKLTLPF